ncbi:RNA polymerase subunit sigma-70 [Cryptosporangium minutisporangium]|uniref:Sigma-70 family RNA polymerase sigma factor n=1 Tax=Cryptosporangium minutisporangium TaxID=113569 RepID=A0ABP6T6C2_9ACTN
MTDLDAARAGDQHAFGTLVGSYRRELEVYCYRMLGGTQDAEDAVQETLLAAWRGLPAFEERSSLRTWLYRIATRCCLRLAERRPPRVLSWEHGPARNWGEDLGAPVDGPVWVEPLAPDPLAPDAFAPDPGAQVERRETIALAYIAALQRLPATQRAVLILREVLAFSAQEVADLLETSTASVNSALQRARATMSATPDEWPGRPEVAHREAADAFVAAFVAGDVDRLVRLLTDDVRFTMPPLPAWFDGVDAVREFFATRVFATPWRAVRVPDVNGQPAFIGHQEGGAALVVLHFRGGQVCWVASFLEPGMVARFQGISG